MFEKVTENTYAHTKGETIGNVGVIASEKGNFLIDTSMFPKVARRMRIEIEKMKSGKIAGAILTHYHADHTWGSMVFKDKPLHAHELVHRNMKNSLSENWSREAIASYLAANPDRQKMLEGLEIMLPNNVFKAREHRLSEDETIVMIRVGGHTNGSTLILYEEENVLFAGDNLFAGVYPWGGDQTASPYSWINALDIMLELKPKHIVPGHGSVQDDLKEVEHLKSYLKNLVDTTESLIREATPKEKIMEELDKIGFHSPKSEDFKQATLEHFYEVILENLKKKNDER